MSQEPKSSPTKYHNDTRGLSHEEMIEWAKNVKPKKLTTTAGGSTSTMKKKKAEKKAYFQVYRAKEYSDREKRAEKFGDEYKRKIRYLYHYNPEWRARFDYRQAKRKLSIKRTKYNAWLGFYYKNHRNKLINFAQSFKVNEEDFMQGFTPTELVKYLPIATPTYNAFVEKSVFPKPIYSGLKFEKKSMGKKPEEFYSVQEAEAFLKVFAIYRKKFTQVKTEEQEQYLTKQLWLKALKIRKEFNDR